MVNGCSMCYNEQLHDAGVRSACLCNRLDLALPVVSPSEPFAHPGTDGRSASTYSWQAGSRIPGQ